MSKEAIIQRGVTLKDITAFCRRYGFVFPSSEIYDGLAGVYDYGPAGVELKKNIREWWWYYMVYLREDIVGLDSSILTHEKVWQASGHIDMFHDFFIDDKECKGRFRADDLLEDFIQASITDQEEKKKLLERLKKMVEAEDSAGLTEMIHELGIQCPACSSKKWTPVRKFNLMFSTTGGVVQEDAQTIYLRPETAQGIYINFLNVQKTSRQKIPFGIAQTGKAFRNEIVLGGFLLRMREFEQMEMQYFVKPGEDKRWYDYWIEERLKWYKMMGFKEEHLRIREHKRLAHYASAAVDIEYLFGDEFKEVEGIHARTSFDLGNHSRHSGKSLEYVDSATGERYIPHVVETSAGLDRIFMAVIWENLVIEEVPSKKEGGVDIREVLRLPAPLAPYKCAVFPLVRKDNLPEIARRVFNILRKDFHSFYEEKDSIGQRYRRQDAIGTPFCITIDYQTIEDETVTVRDRDTLQQVRVKIPELREYIRPKVSFSAFIE